MRQFETVENIFKVLTECTHNGFPIVTNENECVGTISRNFLVVILKQKFFEGAGADIHNTRSIRADPSVRGSFEVSGENEGQNPLNEGEPEGNRL